MVKNKMKLLNNKKNMLIWIKQFYSRIVNSRPKWLQKVLRIF